jgi:putative transposase
MAIYRRALIQGATYFFTVNTYQRQAVLTRPLFYQALKQSIATVKQAHPFTIEAFVLLPDHLHCLWKLPPQDTDYAKRWNIIKRLVSQKTRHLLTPPVNSSRLKRRELALWQRRFWEHQIRDERDFEKHVEYIHWNPVKHRYVETVADWPYSSFHHFVRRGIYPKDWAGTAIHEEKEAHYGEPV